MAELGFGRVLVAVYPLFALAAGARALVQLATAPSRAPVAYVLSAVAARSTWSPRSRSRGRRGGSRGRPAGSSWPACWFWAR
jgi:hypothetical protein